MLRTPVIITFLFFTSLGLSAQQSPQTWVTFRVNVDNLRVRNAPDKNAKVVAELPEHTQLKYMNETAGAWDEVTLRGEKHKARWYKVAAIDSPVEGWVYGGAVVISSVYMERTDQMPEFHYDFVDLHQITKAEYDAVAQKYHNPVVYDTLVHQLNDSTIILKFENGKEKTIVSTIGESEDNITTYTYLGQIPAAHQYLVEGVYYEDMDITMYDTRNGSALTSLDFPDMPQLSLDEKWLAMGWSNPYENDSGIQIYKNTPEGIFESSLITLPTSDCTNLCWDRSGSLFFKYRQWTEDKNAVHYYCLKMPHP